MTIEEKAKAYDEALKRAKAAIDIAADKDLVGGVVRTILPELVESKDERIIRAIIDALYSHTNSINLLSSRGYQMEDIEAWLEKQKEQKVDIDKLRRDIYQSGYNDGYQHGKEDAQKEQKPNIELIQRSWYMEGYNDRKFGNEPKWIIKTGEGGPKHELNPRYGQPLTERQVTEEQLHNLNEAIKSFRMDGFDRIADSLHSLYNILTTQAQKSAEWSEEDETRLTNILIMLKEYVIHHYSKDDVDKSVDWLENRFKSLRPQPKQEWSEEDEKKLERVDDLLWMLDDYFGDDCSICEERTARLRDEIQKELCPWLKSLRPQYHGDVTMTEAYKMGLEAGKASSWKPSEDELTKKHLEGYIKGRNDALREMSDFMESHFDTTSGTSTLKAEG